VDAGDSVEPGQVEEAQQALLAADQLEGAMGLASVQVLR
jgi:hypothetical protein